MDGTVNLRNDNLQDAMRPNEPLAATLAAAEWNVVFFGLGKVAYELSAPVIDKLRSQLAPPQDLLRK